MRTYIIPFRTPRLFGILESRIIIDRTMAQRPGDIARHDTLNTYRRHEGDGDDGSFGLVLAMNEGV